MRTLMILAALSALSAPALAGDLSSDLLALHDAPDRGAAAAAIDADADALRGALDHADWRVRAQAGALLAEIEAPDLYDAAWAIVPPPTRAGYLRISSPLFQVPEAAPLLLVRLEAAVDGPEVRAALAEALTRTEGDWSEGAAALLAIEESALVRRALTSTFRYADAEQALPALSAALGDSHPDVRAEAALVLGQRADGDQAADALIDALEDEYPQVRAAAARSLYWRRVESAWGPLQVALGDVDAEVRYRALYAMKKLDPERAAALPELASLKGDSDARIARIAGQLAE